MAVVLGDDDDLPGPPPPPVDAITEELADVLAGLDERRGSQETREEQTGRALVLALRAGLKAGVAYDGIGCVLLIDLPGGTVVFPMPPYPYLTGTPGQDPGERRTRIRHFREHVLPPSPGRALHQVYRAAAEWVKALSAEARQEVGELRIAFDPDGSGLAVTAHPRPRA